MADDYLYNLALRFRAVVSRHADRPALRLGTAETLSYDALNRLANRIARHLHALGIPPGGVVAIGGEKHAETYATMLAALKLGVAYCVLDPDNPAERLRKILSRCSPRVVVAGETLSSKVQPLLDRRDCTLVDGRPGALDSATQGLSDGELTQSAEVTGAFPAYVMYTSGSTGHPKGAVMTHANVANLVDWSRARYGFTEADVLTNVNPLYFDNSVFDFYASLFNGACLAVFPKDVVARGDLLLDRVDEYGCTSWFSVPSLLIYLDAMKLLHRDRFRTLRRIIFGGEGYPKARLKRLFDLYGSRVAFHNVYGPTECTCICSDHRISERDFQDLAGLPTLGKLIPNFSGLILDGDNRPVPDGEVGELCLLGPQVGRGYWNDPERTAASFVQNPLNTAYRDIMYRTGDLVRRDPIDGFIYFQGRKDFQIKHMGYRIELEEIEAGLACLPYVRQAGVVHGRKGEVSQIVGVIACEGEIDEAQVRRDLKQILPPYMIPTAFYFVADLPKNANGKVDRRRLAETYLGETT